MFVALQHLVGQRQTEPTCIMVVLVVVRGAAPLALYLQPVTLLESMVTEPRKAGYCILTPSLANIPALLFAFEEP